MEVEKPATDMDMCSQPPLKRRKTGPGTSKQHLREFGLMRNSSGEDSASFVGSASGIYFIRSVYRALAADGSLRSTVQMQTPDSDVVPGEDDQLSERAINSGSRNLWRATEVSGPMTPGRDGEYSFEDLLAWTQSYFDQWHPAYPFIHAPSVLRYLEFLAQRSKSATDLPPPSSMLTVVRSIMSISLADRRQSGAVMVRPVPAHLTFGSFDAAMDSASKVLSTLTSIESLQAAVSVQLFLVSMLRHNAASRLGGIIVRMAFQLGLHRCPVRFSGFSPHESALRKRLFWTIYCLDRYICQSIGLPLAIRDDDIDVCYAGQERHTQDGPSWSNAPGSAGNTGPKVLQEADQRLNLLNFLARHAEIRGQIMELRNKSVSHSNSEDDRAIIINAGITKWWNEVDEWLDPSDASSSIINPSHRTALTILRYESIIALNRPILATATRDSTYRAALQDCINASRSVITLLHRAMDTPSYGDVSRVSNPTHIRDPLTWPSLTWTVWMSAFLIIYAANEKQFPAQAVARITNRSLDVLKYLSLRGSVWPGTCAIAIRDLRNRLQERQDRFLQEQNLSDESPVLSRNTSRAVTPSNLQQGSGPSDSNGYNTKPRSRMSSTMGPPSQSNPIFEGRTRGSRSSDNAFNNFARQQPQLRDEELSHRDPSQRRVPSRNLNDNDAGQNEFLHQFDMAGNNYRPQTSDLSNRIDQQSRIDELMDTTGAPRLNEFNPLLDSAEADLFYHFDIPFWMGDDEARNIGYGWT